jgi:CRP-like cAMP-binding protein
VSIQSYLNRLLSRSVLNDDEQRAILALPYQRLEVRGNYDFVRLGETVDHACLVADGAVGRFDQNMNGARQITAIHLAGDMADLQSVVQPKATTALQALSPTTILRIPHVALREATARFPALAEALWRDCMVDSGILSQWVVNVGRRDARARLAHLLCEIATRRGMGARPAGVAFPFAVTQAQLADATGLTIVHVNRVLKGLRMDGLAAVRRHEIEISDWEKLAEAGEFDDTYLQITMAPEDRLRILPLD